MANVAQLKLVICAVHVAQLKLVILICTVLVLAILANEVVFHFGLQVCCQNIYSGLGTLE